MPKTYEKHLANVRQAAELLDKIKTLAGCADCGFNSWPEALQFDHVDPHTKRQDLGWFKDRSRLNSRAKLTKFLDHVERYCVIRCANCHARRTKLESHWQVRRDQPIVEVSDVLF
jgi:hypothetical protein